MSDRCKGCRFFNDRAGADGSGYCRRYPPRVMDRTQDKEDWCWPIVHGADWCGEWQKKPEAV